MSAVITTFAGRRVSNHDELAAVLAKRQPQVIRLIPESDITAVLNQLTEEMLVMRGDELHCIEAKAGLDLLNDIRAALGMEEHQ